MSHASYTTGCLYSETVLRLACEYVCLSVRPFRRSRSGKDRHTETDTDRQTETDRDRDRQTETERHRQGQRQTDNDKQDRYCPSPLLPVKLIVARLQLCLRISGAKNLLLNSVTHLSDVKTLVVVFQEAVGGRTEDVQIPTPARHTSG